MNLIPTDLIKQVAVATDSMTRIVSLLEDVSYRLETLEKLQRKSLALQKQSLPLAIETIETQHSSGKAV